MTDIAIEWVCWRAIADVAYHRRLDMVCGGSMKSIRLCGKPWEFDGHMSTSSSSMPRILVRSLTIPMILQNGKESESVHRKGVKKYLIVSLVV